MSSHRGFTRLHSQVWPTSNLLPSSHREEAEKRVTATRHHRTGSDRALQKLGVPDLQQCKLVKCHKIFRTVLTAISISASLN